jgi:hypothetical protein
VVCNTSFVTVREREAVPHHLVVPAQAITGSRIKPECKVKQGPNAVSVWDASERSRSNRQSRAFFFKHGVETSDDINTLHSIVGQSLSVTKKSHCYVYNCSS